MGAGVAHRASLPPTVERSPGDFPRPARARRSPLFVTSRLLERHGLPHLFTTRHFPGVARPTESRPPLGPEAGALLGARGLAGEPAFARQVHGAEVIRVVRGGFAGRADALTTSRAGVPLCI